MNANTETETVVSLKPKRIIGIRPRVKVTTKGEERPTQIFIKDLETGDSARYEIESEQDEFDFIVWGKWPKNGKYREVTQGEDLTAFLPHHVIADDAKEAEKEGRDLEPTRVPVAYEGVRSNDLIVLTLGGLGDCMAFALSKRSEREPTGIMTMRIAPYLLKERRPTDYKDDDAVLLVELASTAPELFFSVTSRDRAMITLRETERLRRYLMQDRIAANNRCYASARTTVWCNEDAYPEGSIEALYDSIIANDTVLQAMIAKEKKIVKDLTKLMNLQPLFQEVGEEKGLGPMTLSSIIAAITDIRRFPTVGKFKAYCGLHVQADGKFPRRRTGERTSWPTWVRQAFYLLGESFVKNSKKPDCYWGRRLVANKAMYRTRHPYTVLVEGGLKQNGESVMTSTWQESGRTFPLIEGAYSWNKKTGVYTIQTDAGQVTAKGKQKYTNAHIHRMGIWRTVSEFGEWLYWKWRTIEGLPSRPPRAYPPTDTDAVKAAVEVWNNGGNPPVKFEAPQSEDKVLEAAEMVAA